MCSFVVFCCAPPRRGSNVPIRLTGRYIFSAPAAPPALAWGSRSGLVAWGLGLVAWGLAWGLGFLALRGPRGPRPACPCPPAVPRPCWGVVGRAWRRGRREGARSPLMKDRSKNSALPCPCCELLFASAVFPSVTYDPSRTSRCAIFLGCSEASPPRRLCDVSRRFDSHAVIYHPYQSHER
jgi:hypothetical protein